MLIVDDLVKYYGKNKGIEDLSFTLEKQELLGIVGTNGSGKTTTFRLLLKLLVPDSGSIQYNGNDIAETDHAIFGYLPEERSVYRDLRVYDQVVFLAKLKGLHREIIEQRLDAWLQRMDIVEYKYRRIKELSKGNQQKIQMICALIHDPQVVILDEPLSGLDVINVKLFKEIIHELREQEKMIMISSHQYEHIEEFCEKIILLKQGEVAYYGKVKDLKKSLEIRYITLMFDEQRDYSDVDGVLLQQRSVNMTRLKLANETKAKKLLRQLLREKEIVSIKMELPTLADLVQERSLL